MKNLLLGILLGIVLTILTVVIVGMVKFNILQDDIYIELEDGSVVPWREVEESNGLVES